MRVHDSHAEPLARRALLLWLYSQIHLLLDLEQQEQHQNHQQQLAAGTSRLSSASQHKGSVEAPATSAPQLCFLQRASKAPSTGINPGTTTTSAGGSRLTATTSPLFELKPGVTVHLYCSSCPCGNATLRRWAQAGPGGDASLGPEAAALPPDRWPEEQHPPLSLHAVREGQVQLLVKRDPELASLVREAQAMKPAASRGGHSFVEARGIKHDGPHSDSPDPAAALTAAASDQGDGQSVVEQAQNRLTAATHGRGSGASSGAQQGRAQARAGKGSGLGASTRNDGRGANSCGREGMVAPGTIEAGALQPRTDVDTSSSKHGGGLGDRPGGAAAGGEAAVPLFPLTILSCSDKIALWQALGAQGALLARFFAQPVCAQTITVNRKFSRPHLRRALCCRLASWRSCSQGNAGQRDNRSATVRAAGTKDSGNGHGATAAGPEGLDVTGKSGAGPEVGGCQRNGVVHPTLLSPTALRVFDADGENDDEAFGFGLAAAWWAGAGQPVRLNGRTGLLWRDGEPEGHLSLQADGVEERLEIQGSALLGETATEVWGTQQHPAASAADASPICKAALLRQYEHLCERLGVDVLPALSDGWKPTGEIASLSWCHRYQLAKRLASPTYEADRQLLLSSPMYFIPAQGTAGHPPGAKRRVSTGFQRKSQTLVEAATA